jgi:hypothetical protein
MKLGLIGGGFKPFTTGHFTLLSKAMADSDVVVVFYGLAGRKKGSGYNYSREMSMEIYEIVKTAIEREYAGRAHVVLGVPTPIVKTFQAIEEVKDGQATHGVLSSVGINPASVGEVAFFSSPEDLMVLNRHLGTPKEEKYFGDLYQTGQLKFIGVNSAGDDITDILDAVRPAYPDSSDEDLTDLVRMRGSQFRALISARDEEKISRYLPNFLNDAEKKKIIDVLLQGLNTSENLFRSYVQALLKENQ